MLQQYAYRGPGLLIDIPEPMVTDFSRDITEGIAGTGVKAAFLKCCMETAEPTPGVERITRAIARAHLETGAPITVHTSGPHHRWLVRAGGRVGGDIPGGDIADWDIGGRPVCRLYGRSGSLRGGGSGPEQVPLATPTAVGISAGIAVAAGLVVT